jgi:aspartyl-tRNA(Asn)/glutamyl-tRNA(Gln) amidotransferase subunit B
MRSKEEAHDYRYFPDPDLLPLEIDDAWIDAVRAALPELPAQRRARFVDEFKLPDYDAGVLTASREMADYYETCLQSYHQPKGISNWVMGPLLGLLNSQGKSIEDSPVAPDNLAALVKMIDDEVISSKIAKTVFEDMAESGRSPGDIVEEKGLAQVSDTGAIEAEVDRVIAAHPDEVGRFQGGQTKLMGFFVGQVMKATRGQANPQVVNQLLAKKLSS